MGRWCLYCGVVGGGAAEGFEIKLQAVPGTGGSGSAVEERGCVAVLGV